jgi:DNA repair exonuclease SbcCD nuclease subunit
MVWKQFEDSVINTKADIHICVGDIFDSWLVSYDVILRAALTYLRAPLHDTEFVVIKGNHDLSRDLERSAAYDVLKVILDGKVEFIDEPRQIGDMGFVPWSPLTLDLTPIAKCRTVFGHWDVEAFGDTTNLIPTKQLAEFGIKKAYTGHDHKARKLTRDGVNVTVVGSMQPYAHGEESDAKLYVTVPYSKVIEDPTIYHDKCLRVLLDQGDVFDIELDCLQLTLKYEDDGTIEEQQAVQLGDFDMGKLFTQVFDEFQLPPEIRAQILTHYEALRTRD